VARCRWLPWQAWTLVAAAQLELIARGGERDVDAARRGGASRAAPILATPAGAVSVVTGHGHVATPVGSLTFSMA
jgi:hypothetical protein